MMCFSKSVAETDQRVKTVGIAYTADQLLSFAALGLCVDYKADSLKLYACRPQFWHQQKSTIIDFFNEEKE